MFLRKKDGELSSPRHVVKSLPNLARTERSRSFDMGGFMSPRSVSKRHSLSRLRRTSLVRMQDALNEDDSNEDDDLIVVCNSDDDVVSLTTGEIPVIVPEDPNTLKYSEDEINAYYTWLKDIIHLEPEEGVIPTFRLSLFLSFYRLSIPIQDIVESKIGSVKHWITRDRDIIEAETTYVQTPVNCFDGSAFWWCNSGEIPKLKSGVHVNLCHIRNTVPIGMSESASIQLDYTKKSLLDALNSGCPLLVLFCSISPTLRSRKNRYIKWLISALKSSKASKTTKINIAGLFIKLIWPQERVPGLLNILWKEGGAHVLLKLAQEGSINIHQEITMNELELDYVIGQGAVGKVHLATYKDENIAVKIASENNPAFVESEFRLEIAIMYMVRHPNILPCVGASCEGKFYFYLSAYQSQGSLRMILDGNSRRLTLYIRGFIALQIARGLAHIHELGIIHRDIKAENIMIDANWASLVGDFGTACFANSDNLDNMIGTLAWMAPEMIEEDSKYDEKIDVYSFGILLYELFTGKLPYSEMKQWLIADFVLNNGRPEIDPLLIPDDIAKLMKQCWHQKPKKRPSFFSIEMSLSSWLNQFNSIPKVDCSPDIIIRAPRRLRSVSKVDGKPNLARRGGVTSVSLVQ